MNFIDTFGFLFKTKSNINFAGLCETIPTNLSSVRNSLRMMPQDEMYAFRFYADQRGSAGAVMWAEAELQRREFILNKVSIALSILAFFISIFALAG